MKKVRYEKVYNYIYEGLKLNKKLSLYTSRNNIFSFYWGCYIQDFLTAELRSEICVFFCKAKITLI